VKPYEKRPKPSKKVRPDLKWIIALLTPIIWDIIKISIEKWLF